MSRRFSFNAGRRAGVEVLDHLDALDVLVQTHLISAQTYRILNRTTPCLVVLLLDDALSCIATVVVDNIPYQADDAVVGSLTRTLGQLPPTVHAVVLAVCWPDDPGERNSYIGTLSQLAAPLSGHGIDLRDIIECSPSGFTSLRADLTEWWAEPPSQAG